MKSVFHFVVIIVLGAVLGSFLGKLCAIWFPVGPFHNLFASELQFGLHPAKADLGVIEFTLGCLFNFNITSVAGILIAALGYKSLLK